MASGDVGYLDDAGRLFVVGRDDEMIVSGGENVYPIEVEKTLAAHPEVAEAAVIGVDDEKYGQRLAAFVVLTPGGVGGTADALKQHVRENLANYKVPREITILDELPRSSTGKILRAELARRGCSDHECATGLDDAQSPAAGARHRGNRQRRQRIRPLARNRYVSLRCFGSGGRPSEVPGVYFSVSLFDAVRRGRRGDFAGPRGKVAVALTAASWAILGVIGYRGVITPGPVLEAGLSDQLGRRTTPRR